MARERIVLRSAVAVVALAGWAGFAYIAWSSARNERGLQDRISTLEAARVGFASDREKLEARLATAEATAARLRDEVILITQSWHKAAADLTSAQAEVTALKAPPAAGAASGGMPDGTPDTSSSDPETPAVRNAPKPQPAIISAQRALTSLGYGPLEADGLLGPKTRTAVQEFQRDKQLAITGELGPETVAELGRVSPGGTQ